MNQKPLFVGLTRAALRWNHGMTSLRSMFRARVGASRERAGVEEYKRLMDSGLRPSHMLRRTGSETAASLVLCREAPKRS